MSAARGGLRLLLILPGLAIVWTLVQFAGWLISVALAAVIT